MEKRIAAFLNARNVTVSDLVKCIGCTKSRAAKILAGTATLRFSDAINISEFLGVNLHNLCKAETAVMA